MKKTLLSLVILLSFLFTFESYPQGVIQNIINQVNSDSMFYFLKELSGNVPTVIGGQSYTITSRNKSQPGNDKAMQYIQQKLDSYGLTTSIQTFSTTGKNVIGIKTGTEFPNKKYIICAHFDDMPSGTTAPGADDNGSGTAAVIEAARVFKNYSFPFTIIFALWDEEEQGLVGSAYYANQLTAADSVLGVVNMDMIAWDSNNDNVAEPHVRPYANTLSMGLKMVELNSTYNIGLTLHTINPGATASDHASFWNKNISAVLLIEDYSNDFHQYYHTVNDNIQYVNLPYYTKCAKLAFATFAYYALNLNISIVHTPVASIGTSAPIIVNAQVQSGLMPGVGIGGAPRLYFRTSTGGPFTSFTSVIGTLARGIYNYQFTIPAQNLGIKVEYYIAVQDTDAQMIVTAPAGGSGFYPPGNTPPPTFYQFFVAPVSVMLSDDASNINNWNVTNTWNITTGKYVSAPSSFTDSPVGQYGASQIYTSTYKFPIDFTNILGATLEFETQWDTEVNYDYAQVQISTNSGTTWIAQRGLYTNLATGTFQPPGEQLYDGSQLTWVHEKMDLSQYAGKTVLLRFFLKTDGSQNKDGWYVDDVVIKTFSATPVELSAFNAVYDKTVKVTWTTATELNNKGFFIEKKTPAGEWNDIAFISGKGTSTVSNTYFYEDKNVTTGKYLYRLRQVDFDGSYKTYLPVEVNIGNVVDFSLMQNYPNPFNPSTRIEYSLPQDGIVTLKVYDILGNLVSELVNGTQTAGKHFVEFDGKNLSSGMYIYQLRAGNFVSVKQMVLLK